MSDDRITPTDLAELKAAEAAASPGPWEWELRGLDKETLSLMHPQMFRDVEVHPLNLLNTNVNEWDWNGKNNRRFIALARTAVPQLIGEVEQLRADKAALIKALQPFAKRSFDSLDFARAATVVQRVKGER